MRGPVKSREVEVAGAQSVRAYKLQGTWVAGAQHRPHGQKPIKQDNSQIFPECACQVRDEEVAGAESSRLHASCVQARDRVDGRPQFKLRMKI